MDPKTSVYVTARGDAYHSSSKCTRITGPHKAAETNGYEVHPPRRMTLAEAQDWKPVTQCPACWNGDRREPRFDLSLGAVEIRYEIGFGFAASTAKGWLSIPRSHWLAILPEDRDERVLEMIKEQAVQQLQINYRVDE